MNRTWLNIGCVAVMAVSAEAQEMPWKRAVAGWEYLWPRDHASHAGFKTEWWYLTGNLRGADGRRFGYQLTFFRRGVRPPGGPAARSRFVTEDIKFGHFTITDLAARKFHVAQQFSRGAFGEAGFGNGSSEPRLAWLADWSLHLEKDGSFRAQAREPGRSLELHLVPEKPWISHGKDGVSIKAAGEGFASHYYSGTRLRSKGTLLLDGVSGAVEGESWFDHEWASDPLAAEQVGWDWFSLQFEDNTELMLYRLRRKDGTLDPASSGTFIDGEGKAHPLRASDMEARVLKKWRSKESGAEYPIGWELRVPFLELEIAVTTPLESQELALAPVTYWEGMVDVAGKRGGKPTRGHGYLELTGYAGPIVGLAPPGDAASGR